MESSRGPDHFLGPISTEVSKSRSCGPRHRGVSSSVLRRGDQVFRRDDRRLPWGPKAVEAPCESVCDDMHGCGALLVRTSKAFRPGQPTKALAGSFSSRYQTESGGRRVQVCAPLTIPAATSRSLRFATWEARDMILNASPPATALRRAPNAVAIPEPGICSCCTGAASRCHPRALVRG
jgi:hypothetical protein